MRQSRLRFSSRSGSGNSSGCAWKQGLITQIEERVEAEPVLSLSTALSRWNPFDNKDIEYLRVRAAGRFLHDQEKHLFSVIDGKSGWRIFTPLQDLGW